MTGPKRLKTIESLVLASFFVTGIMLRAETGGGFGSLGSIYHEFALTLEPGERTEILGPLFYHQSVESKSTWAVPPLLSREADDALDTAEFDFVYPALTYDRYGSQYRFQVLQMLSFSGGETSSETNVHRRTLFPIFFQQRSDDPERNYTAVVPFYGRLRNRLFRDEAFFVMWPAYVRSRKKDVVTDNVLYPIFHYRRGEGLKGWQVWPLFGTESKSVTYRTNHWGDAERVGGHRKKFVLWPFFFRQTLGIGTTNVDRRTIFLPLFSVQRSDVRDAWTAPWPLGISHANDRGQRYEEWGFPWPIIVMARGEGKSLYRVLPLFSRGRTPTLEQGSFLWPIYNYRHIRSAPLDRRRDRILFFLFTNVDEKNTETGTSAARQDLWPLYSYRRDHRGNRRLQLFAPLEPILPHSKSITRNYSPLWSLWRWEKSADTAAASQSLLWNLYRRETDGDTKKCSLLFGLFQYQSRPEGRQWRLFYIPFGSPGPREESSVQD